MKIKVSTDASGNVESAYDILRTLKAMLRQGLLGFLGSYLFAPVISSYTGVPITLPIEITFAVFCACGGSIEEIYAFFSHKPALDAMAAAGMNDIKRGNNEVQP